MPPKSLAAGRTWTATVATTCGTMTFTLDGKKAPQTVASFIFLARKGFFDNTPCHRLTTSGLFVLQCGDPTGTGSGGPGYEFGIENAPATGDYPAGTVAMARETAPEHQRQPVLHRLPGQQAADRPAAGTPSSAASRTVSAS